MKVISRNDETKKRLKEEPRFTAFTTEQEAYLNLAEAIAELAGEDYIIAWRDIKRFGDVMYIQSSRSNTKEYEEWGMKCIVCPEMAGYTAWDHILEIEDWLRSMPFIKDPDGVIKELRRIAEDDSNQNSERVWNN